MSADSRQLGLPLPHFIDARLKRHPSTMGPRFLPLLAASSCMALCVALATVDTARAQSAPAKATPSPKSGGVKADELPLRDPVRREVQPLQKRATQQSRETPPPAAASGASPVTPSATTSANSAEANSATADAWSEAEIRAAKAACTTVLRGVDAVYTSDDPIKQGACGAPVVFKVSHVGKGPSVELSPPVMLTCEMIASLDKWMKADVQPRARSLLGGSIVKIDTMSSYSCRNAYGRVKSKLSEHGRVNAIDIGSLSTAKDSVSVLADWGLTEREQRVAAAKQEAERAKLEADRAAAAAAAARRGTGAVTTTLPGSTIIPLPSISSERPSHPPAVGLVPYRLGGPKSGATAAVPGAGHAGTTAGGTANNAKRTFLRDIHAAACKHFGTVLGPEANNAHKNHFHLDMAPRNRGNFCE